MPSVIVTGATGYIGSGVVRALVREGYSVTGVTSKPENSSKVSALGATPLVASVVDLPDLVASKILHHDAFINCAADYSDYPGTDAKAVTALVNSAEEAKKQGRRFVSIYTSGCLILGNSDEKSTVTEESKLDVPSSLLWRKGHEDQVLAANGLTAVLRPGFVWGDRGSHGAQAVAQAKADGAVKVIGAGGRFPWIHVDDLANQYVAVLKKLAADGGDSSAGLYNAVDGRASLDHTEVFQAVSRAAGTEGKITHVPLESARANMGAFADLLQLRQGTVSADKIKSAGWTGPTHGTPVSEAAEWVASNQ